MGSNIGKTGMVRNAQALERLGEDGKVIAKQLGVDARSIALQISADGKSIAYQLGTDGKLIGYQLGLDGKIIASQIGADAKEIAYQLGDDGKLAARTIGQHWENSSFHIREGMTGSANSIAAAMIICAASFGYTKVPRQRHIWSGLGLFGVGSLVVSRAESRWAQPPPLQLMPITSTPRPALPPPPGDVRNRF